MVDNSGIGRESDPGSGGDQAAAALALRQQGNVTTQQLLAAGLNRDAIAHRVRAGRLFPVHQGVYAVGRPPRTALELAAAAVLACGPGAALSHDSALALWGLAKRWPEPPEVTAPSRRRPKGVMTHRSGVLRSRDIRTQLGIRVTSPARTLLDCAPRGESEHRLARLVNDALLSSVLTRGQLLDACERFANHPGAALLRPLAQPRNDGPTRSEFEDRFLTFCRRHGFPRPRVNVTVAGHLVDALFPEQRLIVELDGWRFHGDRRSFESDRARDADALAAGLATLRITWERLVGAPADEAERLRQILAQRPGASGAPPS